MWERAEGEGVGLLTGRAGEGGKLGWCGLLGQERSGPPGWAERGEREKCCGLALKLGLGCAQVWAGLAIGLPGTGFGFWLVLGFAILFLLLF